MAKIVYRQMPTPRDLPQQIPTPGQKLGCKSPGVGANFRGYVGGGAKIDSCITLTAQPSEPCTPTRTAFLRKCQKRPAKLSAPPSFLNISKTISFGEKLSKEKLFLTKCRIQPYVTITFLVTGNYINIK